MKPKHKKGQVKIDFSGKTTRKVNKRARKSEVKKTISKREKTSQMVSITKPLVSTTNSAGGDRLNEYWFNTDTRLVAKTFSDKNRLPKTFKPGNVEFVSKYFDLKGIQFGNWLSQEDRLNYLVSAAGSMYDMRNVLNLNSNLIGFFGRVTLAFGARGRGGAGAHFEPDTWAINLTRYPRASKEYKEQAFLTKGGVGALSHEWGHALDRYLAIKTGSKLIYITGGRSTSYKGPKVVPGTVSEWANKIIDICNIDPKTGQKSTWRKALDEKIKKSPLGDYWIRRTEIFARAFESYLSLQFRKRGIYNDFITEPKYQNAVYPTNNQLQQMQPYFDKIVTYLRKQNS